MQHFHKVNIGLAISTPIPAVSTGNGQPALGRLSADWHRRRTNLQVPTNFNMVEVHADGLPVADARNIVVRRVLEHDPRPEYIFFLDWDVLPEFDAIRKLLYRAETMPEYSIYCGVYCVKQQGGAEPLIYTDFGVGPYWHWAVGDLLLGNRIKACHMGLTLIRTSLFERVEPDEEGRWFASPHAAKYEDGFFKSERGSEDIWMCLTPDETITYSDGVKRVSEVAVGDLVPTHRGRWRPVSEIFSRRYSGSLVSIDPLGHSAIRLTPNHPVLILRRNNRQWVRSDEVEQGDYIGLPRMRSDQRRIVVADWVDVRSSSRRSSKYKDRRWLEEHYREHTQKEIADFCGVSQTEVGKEVNRFGIAMRHRPGKTRTSPMPSRKDHVVISGGKFTLPASFDVTPRISRMFGLYLAEGHVSKNYAHWSFDIREQHLKEAVDEGLMDIDVEPSMEFRNGNSLRITVGHKTFASLLSAMFGTGAKEKRIPADVFHWSEENIWGLLRGYIEGDGSIYRRDISFTTASKPLAYGLRLLLAKVGIPSYLSFVSRKGKIGTIRGQSFAQSDLWRCRVAKQFAPAVACRVWPIMPALDSTRKSPSKCDDRYVWFPVENVTTEQYSGTVHNFSVVDDESYLAGPCIVHNCKRAGDQLGDEFKILVDTSVLAGHEDKHGNRYGLPRNCEPMLRSWLGKTWRKPKLALDLGAGGADRRWPGHKTLTTDLREAEGVDFVMDSRWLNFPDGYFDLVASSHHLEHVPRADQRRVWEEMARVLKPGGKMEHVVPNLEWASAKIAAKEIDEHVYNVLYGAQRAHGYGDMLNTHFFGYTPDVAYQMATKHGQLKQVEIETYEDTPALGYNLVLRGVKRGRVTAPRKKARKTARRRAPRKSTKRSAAKRRKAK